MPVTQWKRSSLLFRKLKFNTANNNNPPPSSSSSSSSSSATSSNQANSGSNNSEENQQLDIDKMIVHVLDCLGALQCVMGQYDSSRAKVFWGAVATIAEIGIDQATGHVDKRHPGASHLLRAYPNDQRNSDGKGWLPLHWAAVTDNVDVVDIRNIARADPLATLKGYNQPISANPGHLIAAVRHPKMDVVRCLYNFYPRMASSKDSAGDLPLHYAARYSESLDMILFLLQANPAATKVKGEGDLVPLHNSLYNESEHRCEIAKCLLGADPSAAKFVNLDGDTALHMAIDQECCIELLEHLIKAYPEGVMEQNDIGYLPLHTACLSKDSSTRTTDLIKLLLKANLDGVRIVCSSGHLPVHIAAENSTPEVLDLIVEAHPEGIYQPCVEDNDNTPLVKAIMNNNEPCVSFICTKFPIASKMRNKFGCNPMHFAAEGDNVEILKSVHNAYPENIKLADEQGKLPLHAFVMVHQDVVHENGNEADCLRFLLKHYPQAVGITDAAGDTPLSLCDTENKYIRRLLLAELPELDPEEYRAILYDTRRMAMFLAFAAINADGIPNIFFRLRAANIHLLKMSLSYL